MWIIKICWVILLWLIIIIDEENQFTPHQNLCEETIEVFPLYDKPTN